MNIKKGDILVCISKSSNSDYDRIRINKISSTRNLLLKRRNYALSNGQVELFKKDGKWKLIGASFNIEDIYVPIDTIFVNNDDRVFLSIDREEASQLWIGIRTAIDYSQDEMLHKIIEEQIVNGTIVDEYGDTLF